MVPVEEQQILGAGNRLRIYLLSVVMLVALSAALQVDAVPRGIKRFAEPVPAPHFSLKDLAGETHRLSDYAGRVVIVNFWATWCRPCVKEMPSMQRAWEQLKQHDIELLAINVGEEPEEIRRFLEKRDFRFPLPLDRDSAVMAEWLVQAMPTSYVVDPSGRIVIRIVGEYDWESEALLSEIRALASDSH